MGATVGAKVCITNRRGDKYYEDPTGLPVLDTMHRHIHEGEAFFASHKFAAVANSASVEVMIEAGSVKDLHLQIGVTAEGTCHVDVFKNSTHNHGTGILPQCFDLGVDGTNSEATVSFGPSGGSDGSQIVEDIIPGGSRNFATGGSGASRNELIIPPNMKLLITITNESGGSIDLAASLSWYEEDPI